MLRLPGPRQDANSIYFLMEAVTAGEMWSIIYEGVSGFGEGELPIEHGRYRTRRPSLLSCPRVERLSPNGLTYRVLPQKHPPHFTHNASQQRGFNVLKRTAYRHFRSVG